MRKDNMTDHVSDRFLELPDDLIHHICSFLDMKEVCGTTLLSTRWRYLWRSLSNLNFDQQTWCSDEDVIERRQKSWEFVEKVLRRRSSCNIQKLCLSNHRYSYGRRRIQELLDSTVSQHVQEIHFKNMVAPYSFHGEVRTLVLENCVFANRTFISSSGLKYLTVDSSTIANIHCEIVICAPNLKVLQLKGGMFDRYNMDIFPALVSAEIDVPITDLYSKAREVRSNCFSRIFNGVPNVESLTIATHCFKFLPGLFDGLEVLPISFNNLKNLKLTEWRERGYVKVMANLFGCFPKLEILTLERAEPFGSEKEGDWEAVSSSDSIFGHLKIVEIQKPNGSKNEYRFFEFLLDNATVLEQITMNVAKILSEEKAKELIDLRKKLHMMRKISPSVTVKLLMRIEG